MTVVLGTAAMIWAPMAAMGVAGLMRVHDTAALVGWLAVIVRVGAGVGAGVGGGGDFNHVAAALVSREPRATATPHLERVAEPEQDATCDHGRGCHGEVGEVRMRHGC
jgi:hypothetical protein